MTLELRMGTQPDGLPVKARGVEFGFRIDVGDYALTMEDFLAMAEYVLTNTDLAPHDPRLAFVRRVAALAPGPGFNAGRERLR